MINPFDYLNSSIMSGNGFGDAKFKTFDRLGGKKENDTGWLVALNISE